jgi:hypothetical protein
MSAKNNKSGLFFQINKRITFNKSNKQQQQQQQKPHTRHGDEKMKLFS